jgi:glycosyltransferase involved in cell wall biosynthesis
MACGTPVVALRGGAVPEVVVDGVTGFVCDRPDELSAAIDRVHTLDPADCRRHVAANFDVSTLGYGYQQIYRKVIRRHAMRNGHRLSASVVEPLERHAGILERDQKVSA